MMSDVALVRGGWKQERIIGSGGFGTVTLWRNEESDMYMALKRCRFSSEMTAKHKDRWVKEIDIMLRLNHPNVIMAVPVPEELNGLRDELPLLGMEYCVGGDLRKVLLRPENCVGLAEYQVRALVHDVASGIEYLHHTRIIHRDLKPENIVLQKVDEKTVYKIIDLGYAKDLEQSSACTSFVGTLQYLAPELFSSMRYSCRVDYWSFGILVFEAITGFRPFLPNVQPVKWHREVAKKDNEHIYVWYDRNKETHYSKNLPSPTHLCRTSRQHFEQWLRLMLIFDHTARGGGLEETPTTTGTTSKRPRCFRVLDNILNQKLVFILCVSTGQVLTYPVQDSQTMASLQLIIEQESKIPVQDQELLLASGISPDPEKPAEQGWAEMAEEEWLVFLFTKNMVNYQTQNRRLKQPPELVQTLLKEPNANYTNKEQRVMWGHATYFCSEIARDYRRLLQAQRAAMMSLLRGNSNFSKLKLNLDSEFVRLQAQAEFFKHGLSFDITKYQEQTSTGISSQKLTTKWKKMEEESVRFLSMKEDVLAIDAQYSALSTRVVELQRSPFAKMKRIDVLEENENNARQEYENLRQKDKDKANQMENKIMVTLVKKCMKDRERLTTELYHHLGKIAQCKQELESLSPKLEKRMEEIEEAKEKLRVNQHQRQNDMWTILGMAIKQQTAAPFCSQPSSLLSAHPGAAPDGASAPLGAGLAVSQSSAASAQALSSSAGASQCASLASIVEQSSLESTSVVNENQTIKHRLFDLLGNLQEEHAQSMNQLKSFDWSFMSGLEGGSSASAKPQPQPVVAPQYDSMPRLGTNQSTVYTSPTGQTPIFTQPSPLHPTSSPLHPSSSPHLPSTSPPLPMLTPQQQIALTQLLQQAAASSAPMTDRTLRSSPAMSLAALHGLTIVEEELETAARDGSYQPVPAPRSYSQILSQSLSGSRSATPSPPLTAGSYSAQSSPLHKYVANGGAYLSHTHPPHIRVSPPANPSSGHKGPPPRIPPRSPTTTATAASSNA